jgi:hypothetical protein
LKNGFDDSTANDFLEILEVSIKESTGIIIMFAAIGAYFQFH